jgi:hypothetical protein
VPLRIAFRDGARAGQALEYDDTVERIVFGRDPAKCRVVFPAELTAVGREHCALRRVLGRYRLVLAASHAVLVDGRPARDDQELDAVVQLQLGDGGPAMTVETLGNTRLPDTMRRTDGGAPVPVSRDGDTNVRSLKTKLQATRMIAIGAALSLSLVVVAIVGTWWVMSSSQKKTGRIVEEQAGAIRQLQERIDQMKANVPPQIQDALRKAAPSVYLVVIRDGAGHEVGAGTAWVAAPGILGTNAHVADIFNGLQPGQSLIARSSATPPFDFTVTGVVLHPGYAEFARIWAEYKPTKDSLGPSLEQLQGVAACDVALMHLKSVEGLAPPLPLAAAGQLDNLPPGAVIGYVGFPMESMALGGVNVKQPVPQTQVGNITAMTDYFLMRSPTGGHLMQHSLPIAGGASGSPILDVDGRVIALVSAGNLTANPSGVGRISTGVGVNFGQRADLLTELLEDRAAAAQQRRAGEWRESIKKFTSMRDKIVDIQVEKWIAAHPGLRAHKVAQLAGTVSADFRPGLFTAKHAVDLPDGGAYFVIAVAGNDATVNLFVFDRVGGAWTNDHLLGRDEAVDWYSFVGLNIAAKMSVEIVVSSPTKDLPYTIQVFRTGP